MMKLIHEADPQSLLVVIIVSAHVVHPSVRPSPLFTKQNKFQANTMFATDETVGLAEWIIDDTCLVMDYVDQANIYFRTYFFADHEAIIRTKAKSQNQQMFG